MRFIIISDDEFSFFINNLYAKINDYNDKEEIINVVKKTILKYKNKLKLSGFYKIKVFLDQKVGLFLEGIKFENCERSNIVDLRVVVYFDEDIYFKTDDYFVIKDVLNIKYYDGYYYCLVKDISDINKIVEFGEFVYGDYILGLLEKSYVI